MARGLASGLFPSDMEMARHDFSMSRATTEPQAVATEFRSNGEVQDGDYATSLPAGGDAQVDLNCPRWWEII